jgi:hypothetical protein
MNNNLEFENEDPSPDSIEDNHPRTNYGEGFTKQETLEEAAKIFKNDRVAHGYDITYDDGFLDGAKWQQEHEQKVGHRVQAERMYSEEDMRLAIKKARDISDGVNCFDAEDISGCTEVCTYGWKFNISEDLIIEQFKNK